MFNIRRFIGAAGLRALAPAWRSLTAKLTSKRHFHHVEWYLALAETFEQHNLISLQCLAVFAESNTLIAVFPFRFMPVQFGAIQVKSIRLASDHIEAETARDLILTPDLAETDFFQGLVRYMAEQDQTWDVIELRGILEGSLANSALKLCRQLPILRTVGGAWGRIEFISCADHDQPLNRISKGFKQNLRTAHNKLKSKLVTFEAGSTELALLKLLPDFLKVESSGWKGELGTSTLKIPAAGTFLRQLISNFSPNKGCEIHLMRVDGEPVATLFGIVTDKIWYIFRIGYDELHHRASPGHLIIENLLKRRSAYNSFDLLTPYNAPPWFGAWKPDKTLQIFNAYVFRPSPRGAELANRVASVIQAQSGQH